MIDVNSANRVSPSDACAIASAQKSRNFEANSSFEGTFRDAANKRNSSSIWPSM